MEHPPQSREQQSQSALEALLGESKRLQAITDQLIRQSRELRTIYLLIEHGYRSQQRQFEQSARLFFINIQK